MKKLNSPLVPSLALGTVLSALTGQAVAELRVVVTPTKTEKPLAEINAQVEVISRDEIEAIAPVSTSELLESRAGLAIGRNGGNGQLTSVFIRGGNSDHTLILIDGVNMAPDIGQAAIQNISPDLIERIEIVKGPRAALYGSNAIGGVVNIITRKAAEGLTGEMNLQAGRYNHESGSVAVNYATDQYQTGIQLSSIQAEGPSAQNAPGDQDAHRNVNMNAYAKANVGKATLGVRHIATNGKTDYDSFGSDGEVDFENQITSLEAGIALEKTRLNGTLSRAVDDKDQVGVSANGDFSKTTRDTIDVQLNHQLTDSQNILVGIEAVQSEVKLLSFGTSIDRSEDRKSILAQYELSQGAHALVTNVRFTDYDSFGEETIGGIEYAHKITADTALFASIATGFKAPSLSQLYGFGGNLELQPEESITRELGINVTKQQHAFKATLFDTDYENLINYVTRNENVDLAENNGLELSYSYSKQGLNIYAGLTSQNPKNKKTGDRLARRSDTSIKAGFNYRTGKWTLASGLQHVKSRKDSAFSSTILKPYTLLDASVSYQALDNLAVTASGKNLGNVEYETASGYNNPKAAYYVGAKLTF